MLELVSNPPLSELPPGILDLVMLDDDQSLFSMATSVATGCNMGNRSHESLAREESRALELTHVGWLPLEPKPPPQNDKIHPSGSPEGSWCPHGAAMLSIDQNRQNTELHLNNRGIPSGTSALASSFLPLHNISVYNQPRTCAMRFLHGAATLHTNFTSQTCALNNQKRARVHGVTP